VSPGRAGQSARSEGLEPPTFRSVGCFGRTLYLLIYPLT